MTNNKEDLNKRKNSTETHTENNTRIRVEKEKGDYSMSTILKVPFEKEVIGLRDLRNNLSEMIGKAVNSFEEIISGNAKKSGGSATASIISTALLDDILKAYQFNPIITFDDETKLYALRLDEIKVYADGDTKEESINTLIELVIDSTNDYFEDKELYMRIPEMRAMYPFYLRIKHCSSIDELKGLLGLLNLDT